MRCIWMTACWMCSCWATALPGWIPVRWNRFDLPLSAANFVETIESHQGITISAPEEIAFINGWINQKTLLKSAKAYGKSPYGAHLKAVAERKVRY